jgi:hypothetical protein
VTTLAVSLIPFVIVGVIAFVAIALLHGRGQPIDLSTTSLFRAYLYLASFGGVIAFAVGAVALVNAILASVLGPQLVYGGSDPARPIGFATELDRRRLDDVVRGATFTLFGAVFWLAHWLARNRVSPGDQGALRSIYVFVGTAVFGIATLVFLPNGAYQVAANSLLVPAGSFRAGIADSLTPGIVALLLWLLYLRQAVEGFGRRGGTAFYRRGPPGPPEPSLVGAPIGPGPTSRSAGAEAVPPEDA